MNKRVVHGPCPKCGSRDNCATYPDGHEWCFGCGYYKHGNLSLESRVKSNTPEIPLQASVRPFPSDVTTGISIIGLQWLRKYRITNDDIASHGIMWSDEQQQLIFPCFNSDHRAIGWQARNFNSVKPKYVTYGQMKFSPIATIIADTCVLVEDVISAIRVSKVLPCVPICGSHVSGELLNSLRAHFKHLMVWLDRDKAGEAYKASNRATLMGFNSRVVVTKLDPKEYSENDIKEILK